MTRPTIKVTEYEWQWRASKKKYWEQLKPKEEFDWSDCQTKPTGNTRVVERQMDDAEYIKYLESYLEESLKLKLENKRIKEKLLDKLLSDKNYVAMCELDTEVLILKEHIAFQEEKFLKVVKKVFEDHYIDCDDKQTWGCKCKSDYIDHGDGDVDVFFIDETTTFDFGDEGWNYYEHLLSEIKKGMNE